MKKEKVIVKNDEKIIRCYPQVINDVDCDHYYDDDYLDNDGNQHCQCRYCLMGRLYKLDEAKLVKGKIVSLNG